MAHPNVLEDEDAIASIVRSAKTVAVIGAKAEPGAPAHDIPALIQSKGLRIRPIHPRLTEVLGEKVYKDLASLGEAVDIVDVFRRSDAIGEVADEVLGLPPNLRPKAVWLQTDIRNDEAAERLAVAGIQVVQDRCLGVYSSRYHRG